MCGPRIRNKGEGKRETTGGQEWELSHGLREGHNLYSENKFSKVLTRDFNTRCFFLDCKMKLPLTYTAVGGACSDILTRWVKPTTQNFAL